MTYSIGFVFLECEKGNNITRALEVCHELLKDQLNMPRMIVIDHDATLMNLVVKMFPTSYALMCRYHKTKM